jgi:type IV secretion system protein VirB9
MTTRITTFAIAITLLSFAANAEQTPSKGFSDPRVRVIDYNPNEVVKIRTFYGVSTHIKLGVDETIKHVAVGDSLAWKIVPAENNLFIKPQEQQADTNVTVVTNKRDYNFIITVAKTKTKSVDRWADKSLIYSLKFRYPDEVAQAQAQQIQAQQEAREKARTSILLGARHQQNWDYQAQGDRSITPIQAYDDGQFIYLSFAANADLPAIYEEDAQGNESLINTNIADTNVIVVHKLVEQLILRSGIKVAAVKNGNYAETARNQLENRTRTAVDTVKRVFKQGVANE